MALDNTVEELIQRVRDITDEDNTTDISDPLILRMLNRAQQELVRILTRRYNPHFMREQIFTTSDMTTDANSQTRVLPMPDQAFGFAVNAVDAKIGDAWFPVQQVPFSYTLGMDNSQGGSTPLSYSVQGNDIYLYPAPDSGTSIRIRHQFRAPKLVKSQGRITSSTSSTIVVDALGSSLSTSVDTLAAFINIVDHLTGDIKATMQVTGKTDATKTLTVQTDATALASVRSEVYGYTTTATMPTSISKDDYVCLADGTCVPYLSHDLTNFLIEIAGFYVKRALGTADQTDLIDRDAIYKAISGMQFGRQRTKKIQRKFQTNNFSWQPFFRGGN